MNRVNLTALLSLTVLTASVSSAASMQTVNVQMSEMKFMPMNLNLKVGQKVVMNISNSGVAPHELQLYSKPKVAPKGEAGWDAFMEKNTLWLASKDVKLTINGKAVKAGFFEVPLKPGEKAVLTFTPTKAGSFEMACHYPGHYEAGMKSPLTVK
ncbi:cupredoxin domain-containing protein [Deinococcus sp.]|uniref:cupredoxin domain-containing protein n=1 Tax=Deinococcus sp. TaxID=47478 RepID=UPI002869B51C|nr:cupredoxin domain-containing protein [Deinococcus sp.]